MISEFNANNLAANLNVVDYIKSINNMLDQPINDLVFIEDLAEHITRTDPCIPHIFVFKYGIILNGTSSLHIKPLLIRYKCNEGRDYIENNENVSDPKYLLSPCIFYMLLRRTHRNNIYAVYCSSLIEAVHRHNNYRQLCRLFEDNNRRERERKRREDDRIQQEIEINRNKIIANIVTGKKV